MLTVRPRTGSDEPAVTRLLTATADRVEALDPTVRLARRASPGPALVSVDAAGTVHGFVRPVLEELAADDHSRLYAPDRSTVWVDAAADDPAAVRALATAIRVPGSPGAEADGVLWPAADDLGAAWWTAAGLECGGLYSLRPPAPLAGALPAGMTVRPATAADAEQVVALHRESVAFQAAVSPYVRALPAGERAFRQRLVEGRSRSYVVDDAGELLGVCEWWEVTGGGEAGRSALLPPGRYAYLNAVAVRFAVRGSGLGRALVAGALAAAGPGLAGSTLWFAPHNPIASQVWPHLGWRPVWANWERRSR